LLIKYGNSLNNTSLANLIHFFLYNIPLIIGLSDGQFQSINADFPITDQQIPNPCISYPNSMKFHPSLFIIFFRIGAIIQKLENEKHQNSLL
jgi:hypothetical protein